MIIGSTLSYLNLSVKGLSILNLKSSHVSFFVCLVIIFGGKSPDFLFITAVQYVTLILDDLTANATVLRG